MPRLGYELGEDLWRWCRPGLGPEGRHLFLLRYRVGLEQLGPGSLLCAELPQAKLASVDEAHKKPSGAVLERRVLVVELQPAGRHQVDEQRKLSELDDGHLADAPHARERLTRKRLDRRLHGLHRDHSSHDGGFDARPLERAAQPSRRDLDFGKLRHLLRGRGDCLQLLRPQQHLQLVPVDAGEAALLKLHSRAGHVPHDL